MKIINKHIYADISEKVIEPQNIFLNSYYLPILAYKVNLITEYDIKMFGKTFHKSKTKEFPFLFKTLDMAKEFCEINPKYEKVCFQNDTDCHSVIFYTYQLTIDKEKLGYIWWNNRTVYLNDDDFDMKFDFDSNSIVDGFVKNVGVQNWGNTTHLSDIKYYGFTDKLTDLVKHINNDNEKHWRFELIENK